MYEHRWSSYEQQLQCKLHTQNLDLLNSPLPLGPSVPADETGYFTFVAEACHWPDNQHLQNVQGRQGPTEKNEMIHFRDVFLNISKSLLPWFLTSYRTVVNLQLHVKWSHFIALFISLLFILFSPFHLSQPLCCSQAFKWHSQRVEETSWCFHPAQRKIKHCHTSVIVYAQFQPLGGSKTYHNHFIYTVHSRTCHCINNKINENST